MNATVNGCPTSEVVDPIGYVSDPRHRLLRGYLALVATALGVGLESCTLDIDTPRSAYLAVDQRIAAFPDRDLAVLWNEEHGWSVAVESRSGADLTVLARLETDTALPAAERVARFVEELCAGAIEPLASVA